MASVVELIERMVGADETGRITGAGRRLYVLRTREGVLCRCHADLSADAVAALERIAAAERGRHRDWPRDYARYLSVLASVARVEAVRAGMLYRVTNPPEGTATRITPANVHLLRGGLDEWRPDVEADRLVYAAIADGRAVSICASVRETEGAHAAGVETLPAYRRRGLAAEAVAAWASAVIRLGATPFYGTTFDNLASQGVARHLAMELVGSEFSVECAATPADTLFVR
jgi:GNAT superfamily N-acetyltransferase